MVLLKPGERVLREANCSEERGGNGVLTLTNSRIVFEKIEGLISKKRSTIFSVGLDKISNVWVEGLLNKKLAMELSWSRGPDMPEELRKYKFSVSGPQDWEIAIKGATQASD